MQTVHILIKGKVQSIFFRSEAHQQAKKLQITGWIRNNPDGSVEAVAQGAPDLLRQFLEWCKQGPPGAQVDSINIEYQNDPAPPTPPNQANPARTARPANPARQPRPAK